MAIYDKTDIENIDKITQDEADDRRMVMHVDNVEVDPNGIDYSGYCHHAADTLGWESPTRFYESLKRVKFQLDGLRIKRKDNSLPRAHTLSVDELISTRREAEQIRKNGAAYGVNTPRAEEILRRSR